MTVLDKLNETLEGIDIRFDEPLKTYTIFNSIFR